MSAKTENMSDLESFANALEQSPDYKVLRRVPDLKISQKPMVKGAKQALILDAETTGLDLVEDEVIELGFLVVEYVNGEIISIRDFGNELRQPEKPIPPEVQKITGITPEMVRGKEIDRARISALISSVSIVIAHNAAFDRPICERLFPELESKPWACSLREISWSDFGFESAKLRYLLLESGFFFEAHRALDDCAALYNLLKKKADQGRTFFEILMESARLKSHSISVRSPYGLRQNMRNMGYRWSNYKARAGGEWRKTVATTQLEHELDRLRNLSSDQVSWSIVEMDAFSRYKIEKTI